MDSRDSPSDLTNHELLNQILSTLQSIRSDYRQLSTAVTTIEGRVNVLAGVKQLYEAVEDEQESAPRALTSGSSARDDDGGSPKPSINSHPPGLLVAEGVPGPAQFGMPVSTGRSSAPGISSRIILTTYPGQSGIDPLVMNWGHRDPIQRGPVVVSRSQSTIRRRNGTILVVVSELYDSDYSFIAIGAHGGSYSIYHALAVANKNLDVEHKPDFTNTNPAVTLGPFPQWADAKKIVSMDPLGHLAPWLFTKLINDENIHIRPTIAITKAHMKLPEIEHSVRSSRLQVDGKICLNGTGELAVTKFAVEPVWYLPGVAERFGIGKRLLCNIRQGSLRTKGS